MAKLLVLKTPKPQNLFLSLHLPWGIRGRAGQPAGQDGPRLTALPLTNNKRMKAVISLGSNTRQQDNISKAKTLLRAAYPDITFTPEVWTDPVGVPTDRYLNCLGRFHASGGKEKVAESLRLIERKMGDSHANHLRHVVLIDLDLISYGSQKLRKIVWKE